MNSPYSGGASDFPHNFIPILPPRGCGLRSSSVHDFLLFSPIRRRDSSTDRRRDVKPRETYAHNRKSWDTGGVSFHKQWEGDFAKKKKDYVQAPWTRRDMRGTRKKFRCLNVQFDSLEIGMTRLNKFKDRWRTLLFIILLYARVFTATVHHTAFPSLCPFVLF
jgi:hypothetical protein